MRSRKRSLQDIIAGLKEAYVRPSAQLFAEIDDIWEKRLDDFDKSATLDPLRLTDSVEVKLIHQMLEFTTTQAPSSKEMERKCLERFETIVIGKRNPKRFNDTHKKFQLALNVYLGTTIYKEEKNWDMLLNHYYDVLYTVNYHPCTYCGKNHSPSVCQLINHPEANKKREWIDSASYKKCKELFLKDTTRLKSFPTLPMYRDL
jgi:hypothetical protein